ncbi:uncharacterized protein [Solanum lycopersicum]|uniref:uncharacterized protein n=1 Tax=Solanum lycopersicum TaxID=4081 RepID=UPI003748A629
MPAEVPTPPANVSSVHVSSQVTKDKFVYPDIEEMKQHMKEYVDSKFEYLVNLIKANQIEVIMLRTDLMKEMDDKSTSHMVEVSDEEGNDGHQTEDTLKNHQVMKDISELQSPNANSHHTDETCEHRKDSTPSGSTSPNTREAMNTLIADLGSLPINANQQELTNNQSLLSDSQLPIDISITDIIVRSDINTPHARNRMPSRHYKSPYLTSFGLSEKGKAVMTDNIDVIFYYLRKKIKLQSMDQYRYTTINCLFSAHINNTHDRYYNNEANGDISTQEHLDHARAVLVHERSTINVMKGFSIPAGLPWHLVDDVYILINYDKIFHWVLAVVELNQRLIRVYDSSLGTRKHAYFEEIKKSRMLPSYLIDSGFFENTERTNWSVLDAYKDKQTGILLESHIPLDIEYAEGIMQQEDDSLDCGLYVATFAEFLSDQLVIPPDTDGHLANYLRNRYAAWLWRYDSYKVNGGYISKNDDPPKPKC